MTRLRSMSDPPTDQSAVLLESILQTLKEISEKLSNQEQCRDRLGEGQGSPPTLPSRLGEIGTAWLPLSPMNTTYHANELGHGDSVAAQRLQWAPSYGTSNHDLGAPRIAPLKTGENDKSIPDYRSWRSRLEDSPLHQHSFVTEELGDAWTIPDDGRLPLSFSREVLESLSLDQLRTTVSFISDFGAKMARSDELRFHVIDYDRNGKHIVYRLGKPAVNGLQEFRPNPKINPDGDAPWRRFVLCQALNTVQEIDHDSPSRTACSDKAPFLLKYDRCATRNYLMTAIDRHIEGSLRDQSLDNQYETYWEAFHINFYEPLNVSTPEVTKSLPRGQWRHGPLYGSDEWEFCESALTLIAIPAASDRPDLPPAWGLRTEYKRVTPKECPCFEWSILLLAPLGFFDTSYHQFPLQKHSIMASIGGRSMEGAIIVLLEATYDRLHYNWRLFKNHFRGLLDHGDEEIAFFRPALHDELLQDDEGFSRSRRYAWAIKCLTNFERTISDNTSQWKRFRSARLERLLKPGILSEPSRNSVEKIDLFCTQLEEIRQYFSMKLESTRALRDGLFSASAVIETRASTRLAKNIRLLTFVSIFFQPLAFCTVSRDYRKSIIKYSIGYNLYGPLTKVQSLWSVNNTFSSTALIYTSTVVGLSTYVIVLHLNNLVYQTSSAYTPIRRTIITRMKNDSREEWASKGKQFATFQPKHETLRPSEWWILLFGLQSILTSFSRLPFRETEPDKTDSEAPPAIIVVSGGDRDFSKEAEETITRTTEELSPTVTAFSTSHESNHPPTSESPAGEGSQ